MPSRLRRHASPPMVVACLALFVALGGAGYAATSLPAGSVGAAQIQRNAVTTPKIAAGAITGAKVKDHSIAAADLSRGLLTRVSVGSTGTTGATGPKGDTGPQGPAGVTWANAGTFDAPPLQPACAVASCLGIATQTFTTPATGKLFAIVSATFNYTCDVANPAPVCSPILALYVDGTPLKGASATAGTAGNGSQSGNRTITLTGVSGAVLPAGAHTVDAFLVMNGQQKATLVGVDTANVSEILLGG